jgi:hypothetical protein
MVTIRAGSRDDPSAFRPVLNIYAERAQPWDAMDPGLPKVERNPQG